MTWRIKKLEQSLSNINEFASSYYCLLSRIEISKNQWLAMAENQTIESVYQKILSKIKWLLDRLIVQLFRVVKLFILQIALLANFARWLVPKKILLFTSRSVSIPRSTSTSMSIPIQILTIIGIWRTELRLKSESIDHLLIDTFQLLLGNCLYLCLVFERRLESNRRFLSSNVKRQSNTRVDQFSERVKKNRKSRFHSKILF